MMQVMHADFEPVAGQKFADRFRALIIAFRHEIEGRADAEAHLHLCHLDAPIESRFPFHIVG